HVNNAVDANNIGVLATTNGTGSVFVDGSGAIGAGTHPSQFGIQASNTGTSGGVNVTGSGAITGSGTATGIDARITDAGNGSGILVDRSGAISAGLGINAATAGTG